MEEDLKEEISEEIGETEKEYFDKLEMKNNR